MKAIKISSLITATTTEETEEDSEVTAAATEVEVNSTTTMAISTPVVLIEVTEVQEALTSQR